MKYISYIIQKLKGINTVKAKKRIRQIVQLIISLIFFPLLIFYLGWYYRKYRIVGFSKSVDILLCIVGFFFFPFAFFLVGFYLKGYLIKRNIKKHLAENISEICEYDGEDDYGVTIA